MNVWNARNARRGKENVVAKVLVLEGSMYVY